MKTTIAQRDKLWAIVKKEGTPREQLQLVLDSGLFSDLLKADFNYPINRDDFHRILGLKPIHSDPRGLPIEMLLNRCENGRLRTAIGYICERNETIKTIGDLVSYIAQNPIWRWKNIGGGTVLAAQALLWDGFGIQLRLTVKDRQFIATHLKSVKNRNKTSPAENISQRELEENEGYAPC